MADGGCAGCLYYYAEFSGEILFSIPLMFRRISLLEFQLGLLAEYALFFSVPCVALVGNFLAELNLN